MSGAFLTCPNCQIGDTDTIWLILIGSQCIFRVILVTCATDLAIGAPRVWKLFGRAKPPQCLGAKVPSIQF